MLGISFSARRPSDEVIQRRFFGARRATALTGENLTIDFYANVSPLRWLGFKGSSS